MKKRYVLVHNDNRTPQTVGHEPWGTLIGDYETRKEAEKAFRQRNRHLFDKDFAVKMGLQNSGTFDEILAVDEKCHVVPEDEE